MVYEIQHYTLCDGWLNCWTIIGDNGSERSLVFSTQHEAEKELKEFLDDIRIESDLGNLALDHGYRDEDFRIHKV